MYERILFDIDGTIVNSEWAVRVALAQLIEEEFKTPKRPEDTVYYVGIPGIHSLRAMGFSDPEKADKRWGDILQENYDGVELFPGIKEALETLHAKGYKLGLVTSKRRSEYINEFQSRFELEHLFEGYVCYDDTVEHKPSPEPILEYLKRYEGDPATTLYVADTVHDFNCANQAGVDFALSLWGCNGAGVVQASRQPATPQALLEMLGVE